MDWTRSMNPGWLFGALLWSSIGIGLFLYGKKQVRVPHLVAGVALMAAPCFSGTFLGQLLIAAVILVAFWWVVRAGR